MPFGIIFHCKYTAEILKVLYPRMFHITCAAHLIHNAAMKIRYHFENIDKLISCAKALTNKNKRHQGLFWQIGIPPSVVLTRWRKWQKATKHYADNLPVVRIFVEGLTDSRV